MIKLHCTMVSEKKYIILEDINLVIESYKGNILIEDFIENKQKIFNDPNYSPSMSILMDVRKIINTYSKADFEKYLQFAFKNLDSIGKYRKVAFLTLYPNQVVGATLFDIFEDKPMLIKVFSTVESSLNWLNLHPHYSRIENTLNNLAS